MEWLIEFICVCIGMEIYHRLSMMLITDGTLLIDTSDPEKDIYRFKVDYLDKLKKKKRIVLKVDPNANLSQD